MRSLCETCRHVREITSARGSRFLLCQKSLKDERFAKYPPQPVIRCAGFEPLPAANDQPPDRPN